MQDAELSANQRKALAALLTNTTIKAAAEACGLTERTLHNYLADATFKAALRRRQDEIIASTTAALVGLSGEAVTVLRDVLADSEATHAVKVRAALGWLREVRDQVEIADLCARVERLEAALSRESEADHV